MKQAIICLVLGLTIVGISRADDLEMIRQKTLSAADELAKIKPAQECELVIKAGWPDKVVCKPTEINEGDI